MWFRRVDFRWITRSGSILTKYAFFLPVKVLSRVFRGKFLDRLKRAFRRNQLALDRRFIDKLFQTDWVVYAKPAFGGPEAVLRYLGRYTHRVAISNHRLVAFDGERVTFRWKDYAHSNKQRLMTLDATEFLRRYVQHVLPRGFVRIRHYGYLGNHCRSASITHARKLLDFSPKPREPNAVSEPVWQCPRCGGAMQLGPNFTAGELARRCAFIDTS